MTGIPHDIPDSIWPPQTAFPIVGVLQLVVVHIMDFQRYLSREKRSHVSIRKIWRLSISSECIGAIALDRVTL